MEKKLLILSGRGKLPLLFKELACRKGYEAFTVGVKTVTDFRTDFKVPFLGFAEFEKLVEDLGNPYIVLLGKFDPKLSVALFDSLLQKVRFKIFGGNYERNRETLELIRSRLKNTLPGEVVKAFIRHYEESGFKFLPSEEIRKIAQPLLAEEGLLTPNVRLEEEILEQGKLFMNYAKRLADMEIGQTLIFKDGQVFAVEGAEGTDRTIERGGKLAGKGFCVVKASRSNQDFRIDVPAVGGHTLKPLKKRKAKAIFLESGRVFIVEKERFLKEAEKAGIAVIGLAPR